MSETKPFQIDRQLLMDAYLRVQANRGSSGVDGMSLEEFDKDYKNHLYKIWNKMSSGNYMPPPVRLVEIPKKGDGIRPLGVPTVADRIAQTVVAGLLEKDVDPCFMKTRMDSSRQISHQALAKARTRCWKYAWVIDLDIKSFFGAPGQAWQLQQV